MRKLNNKYMMVLLGIVILTAVVYRNSFTSPFFQDDKTILHIAQTGEILYRSPGFNYFRPIPFNIFYGIVFRFYRYNVFVYHLILFLFFSLSLYFIFKFAKLLTQNVKKSLVTVFFYALNISLFGNFFWIATSYQTIGFLFFLLSSYFYFKKSRLSLIFLIATICSIETGFLLPLTFLLIDLYKGQKQLIKLLFFTLVSFISLIIRTITVGFPNATDYKLVFNLQFVATIRWYVFRAFNLPEGVNRATDFWILIFGFLFALFLLISLFNRSQKLQFKTIIFGIVWFLVGALPYYFLPFHMSAYNITIALVGSAIIFAEVLTDKKILTLSVIIYLLLSIRSLDFLSHTHWLILKNTGPIGSF